MKENCLVSIIGSQIFDGETNTIELTTLGSYYIKSENYYIVYTEYNEDFPDKKTTNIIKIDKNKNIVLTKKGEISSKLILEKGKRHICYYNVSEGSIITNIFTDSIAVNLNEKGGKIKINYSMTMNENFCSQNGIDIEVKMLKNKT